MHLLQKVIITDVKNGGKQNWILAIFTIFQSEGAYHIKSFHQQYDENGHEKSEKQIAGNHIPLYSRRQ